MKTVPRALIPKVQVMVLTLFIFTLFFYTFFPPAWSRHPMHGPAMYGQTKSGEQ